MNNWIVGIFKKLTMLYFWLSVSPFAYFGFQIGRFYDIRESTTGGYGLLGLIVGAAVGLLIASWIFGLVHLLISVNDNAATSVHLQQRIVQLLEKGTDSQSLHNAPTLSLGNQVPVNRSGGMTTTPSREECAELKAQLNVLSEKALLEALRRFGYQVTDRPGHPHMLRNMNIPNSSSHYAHKRGDLVVLLEYEIRRAEITG